MYETDRQPVQRTSHPSGPKTHGFRGLPPVPHSVRGQGRGQQDRLVQAGLLRGPWEEDGGPYGTGSGSRLRNGSTYALL